MTTNYRNDLGTPPAQEASSPGAKEQAQMAADSAAEQSKHVAGVAQEEAAGVASEASDQLRGLVQQATSEVEQQSREQKARLAEKVHTFADDLDSMQSDGQPSGLASQAVQQVARQARDLATRLDGREPREIVDDVRRFARRRPGTFLLGALAAGIVAGRLTRAGKAAQDGSPGGGTAPAVGSAPGMVVDPTPASMSVNRDSTLTAPIPPTDDVASPAYLSEETAVGDVHEPGTPAEGWDPGTTAGPGTGRS